MSLDLKWIHFLGRPGGRDPRVARTLRFFGRKGYLRCDLAGSSRGLMLDDVLWTCEHVAPELFELVPAAVLRFPRSLKGPRPDDLTAVLGALRTDQCRGPDFRGHAYDALRFWARMKSRDGRGAKFRRVSLRLPIGAADRLTAAAERLGVAPEQLVRFALDDYLTEIE